MLKQINPEDLVIGQKYLVEMEYQGEHGDKEFPLNFLDNDDGNNFLPLTQPIYTLDDQPNQPGPELEMLVNVASRLYSAYVTSDLAVPSQGVIAREAAELIAACKRIKEGER